MSSWPVVGVELSGRRIDVVSVIGIGECSQSSIYIAKKFTKGTEKLEITLIGEIFSAFLLDAALLDTGYMFSHLCLDISISFYDPQSLKSQANVTNSIFK